MFPLDFTAAGGVANVKGQVRIFYALYLEVAVTLAAIVVSLLQASASRGIVDLGLKLGLLINTWKNKMFVPYTYVFCPNVLL